MILNDEIFDKIDKKKEKKEIEKREDPLKKLIDKVEEINKGVLIDNFLKQGTLK